MELKNLMEEVAPEVLEDLWKKENMCRCEKCRLDILAMALNNLSPRYVVTDRGKTFSRTDFLELQNRVDVITAISNALRIVKNNPHHE
ncbi:late competence development ComFB family protein [Candidatus Contubernalis alkaliaceticus]|uniref:late competence development ComFB family protein n=1 Tax=Candidatus Contubernalis alkaliaceticus TaxID=338645 RepID=UPI001F4C20EB|nr:late competence development ComFB family protein [Candidatus Contubernalis alkalaceticus]UNC91716.1 late competence development ComFB family protein [Candidatus Contubernalis alkalaceticus]